MITSHIIRLGTHAEKDYFNLARAWYDEVMLNANLVEGTSASTAVFLQQLAHHGKPYTIDPVTYPFALSPETISSSNKSGELRLKSTFRKLKDAYQIPSFAKGDRITRDTLTTDAIDVFCNSVAEYQMTKVSGALADSAAFLEIEEDILTLPPQRILAPYFELSNSLDWLEINLRLLETTSKTHPENSWGVVCLDGLALDNIELVQVVARAYRDIECNGYMIWLTDFNEPSVTISQIKGFLELVNILSGSNRDRPVVNMYGGYFSMLLESVGLTGISHGLGYGERRALVPAVGGGGMPAAKYYLKAIHEEISMRELRQVANTISSTEEFMGEICQCTICSHLLSAGPRRLADSFNRTDRKPFGNSFRDYATQEVYKLARFHFLSNRNAEVTEINNSPLSDLLEQLEMGHNDFQNKLVLDLGYLHRWSRALRSM